MLDTNHGSRSSLGLIWPSLLDRKRRASEWSAKVGRQTYPSPASLRLHEISIWDLVRGGSLVSENQELLHKIRHE